MELKYKMLGVFVLLTGWTMANNETHSTFSENRTVEKRFSVDDGVSIDIENKYGKLVFTNWEKDSVYIRVEIKSEGEKLDKVMSKLNAVQINFTGSKQYVSARTDWTSGYNSFRRSIDEIKRSLNSSGKLTVNYFIYMPADSDLNIDNEFGNVYMGDLTGVLQADIKHGNFRASKIEKIRRLKVRYGDIRINEAKQASIDASFGDLELNKCEDLKLTSANCDVLLDDINSMNLISKNDKLHLVSIDDLSGNMSLSDLKINLLKKKADLNSRFGSVKVNKIDPNFGRLNLTGNFTDYFIVTEEGLNAGFRVVQENGKTFNYPKTVNVTSHESMDKVNTYSGKIGAGGDKQISIHVKNGEVEFRM